MAADPRTPLVLRHPDDTPTTFENVVRILQNPNDKPICPIPVILCTDGNYTLACDTLEYRIEADKVYFKDFEVHSHDLLYINWFANRLSFILIVYRSSKTHEALSGSSYI